VLATVKGTATGFTNGDLTRLIRAGVAETYSIQCDVPWDIAATARQIFWQVSSSVRRPTATISVKVVQGGKTVNSTFTNVAGPDANPYVIFMNEISRLAHEMLPPPVMGHLLPRH